MALKPITINKFDWWLNLSTTSDIKDNQFQVADNVFYNSKWQLQTRYWIAEFWNAIGSNKPVSSYFFFQRDDTLATTAICASWTNIYKFDEITGNWSSIKSWLSEFETITGRTTRRTRRDFAVYKNVIYLTDWVNNYAKYDWSTYTEYASEPKYRYINMNTDRLFWAWVDSTPTTIYFTNPAPTDWSTLNVTAVVIWWDELGKINWMNELQNLIIVFKSGKIYSVNLWVEVLPGVYGKAEPIDAQTGWFSDRTISNVWNSLVYLTERWVDTLQPRTWISWTTAIESSPLDSDVRELTSKIDELQLNSNCGRYIKRLNNYFISFDTNNDNIPDTTLVYNSLVKARTKYNYPNFYDYGFYITADWEYKYLAASATTDRMYQIETGFTDLWEDITYEIKSKDYDFWEPGTFKTFDYVDITGQKSKFKDIELNIEVDGVNVGWWLITDDMIIETKMKETLWINPIWVDTLTGSTDNEDGVDVYEFVCRIPLYATGSKINFQMKSTGWTWILHKAKIGVNKEEIDVFGYANII